MKTIIKKQLIFLIVLFITAQFAFPFEFGLLAGKNTEPSETTLGFSAGMGLLIPMVKFEFEFMKYGEENIKTIGIGLKVRKKIGKLAPYVVIGVGTQFDDFSIIFSGYDYFTSIGGGLHYYIIPLVSLRFDVRYQNFSDFNNVRLSIGAFAHL